MTTQPESEKLDLRDLQQHKTATRFQVSNTMLTTLLVLSAAGLLPESAPANDPKPRHSVVAQQQPIVFRDVGDTTDLLPALSGIRGHGAAWGDIDGSGWPALFVNTFHDAGSKPALLLRNDKGHFRLDEQSHLRTTGAGSGALFVDLTNNGRLDLYVSNCAIDRNAVRRVPNFLFRNDGQGKFTDVSKGSGTTLPLFSGRGPSAIDADGDGLLDLVLCERYYGPVQHGPTLFKNLGNHKFVDASEQTGLPRGFSGLGVAAADLNDDGWTDLFLTEGVGENRLYLNNGRGKFIEAVDSRDVFRWNTHGKKDDTPAGVCIGDVNRDGLPDILIGHHFSRPWIEPAPIRLYLHRGVMKGVPRFEEVTEAAGLIPLTMKAPHVEIQDFDNDGLPDIYVSIVKFKEGRPYPIVFKNLGVENGIPRFRAENWNINDFPSEEERSVKRTAKFLEKLVADKRIMYMAAAPSCDFDRDGRLDLFLANWFINDRSLLLRNETATGNWLDVRVEGSKGVNRMGIGCKVKIYSAGKLGEPSACLGSQEISVGYGYCSGQEAVAHFGLGPQTEVDVEVILPQSKGRIIEKRLKANQRVVLRQ